MSATFSPDHLRASLRPLAEAQPLSTEARAYQRFYGLDFPGRVLRSGLGRFDARVGLGQLAAGAGADYSRLFL